MKQQTLSGFEKYGKTTRRAQFLAEMDQVLPWSKLCALIEPVYPQGTSSRGGRPVVRVGVRSIVCAVLADARALEVSRK